MDTFPGPSEYIQTVLDVVQKLLLYDVKSLVFHHLMSLVVGLPSFAGVRLLVYIQTVLDVVQKLLLYDVKSLVFHHLMSLVVGLPSFAGVRLLV
ncbi:MAG: hypothetical protein GY770_34230 [Aestuariibacter sp.]|nr:hypothetical protein [Aestuariibacter sp.]